MFEPVCVGVGAAPSCLSIELWKNDTGTPELLCRQVSKYGQGHVTGDKFDELGYVVLPPCLWGAKSEGLEPPVYLPPGTPMFSIKRCAPKPPTRPRVACGH